MAKPRVFISSTSYDLRQIRESLSDFIDSLGYESILSEKGQIPYSPELPPDISCYNEITSIDLFVLIIGSRYGTETSDSKKPDNEDFYEIYESITRRELSTAIENKVPIFVFVHKAVDYEYRTYRENSDNTKVKYAHVQNVNTFKTVEFVKDRNRAYFTFEHGREIEHTLRQQWAGLFREYLHKISNDQRIAALADQVSLLQEISKTLRTYMEAVLKEDVGKADELIAEESERLQEFSNRQSVIHGLSGVYPLVRWMKEFIHPTGIYNLFDNASTLDELLNSLTLLKMDPIEIKRIREEDEHFDRVFTKQFARVKEAMEVHKARKRFTV